jgi:hypothetical protein
MVDHPDDCMCELCQKKRGTYYNTNFETGATLEKSRRTVGKQEDRVWQYFKDRPGQNIPRHKVEIELELLQSSIVRALRNLVIEGKLIKNDKDKVPMVMGLQGKMVHTWTLAPPKQPRREQRPLF